MGKWKGFAEGTTLHGVPDIIQASRVAAKIVWGFAVLTVAVLFSIQIGELVISYTNEDTGTLVRPWAPTKVPTINFCMAHYLRTEKTKNNLPGTTDFEAAMINQYMDGYIPYGAVAKLYKGKVDPDGDYNQLAKRIVEEKHVMEKYSTISDFIEANSVSRGMFFQNIHITPLNATVEIESDVNIYGRCFHLDFDQAVSKFQLRGVQVDISTKPQNWKDGTPKDNGLPDGATNSTKKVSKHLADQIYIRMGERSVKGVSLAPRVDIFGGFEQFIDITPTRVERESLRRRKCNKYSETEYNHCILDFERKKCKKCKTLFPHEKMTGEECNHASDNGACMEETMVRMGPENTGAKDACQEPCIFEDYNYVVSTPRILTDDFGDTLTHFIFRGCSQSIEILEYKLVSPVALLSNFGGTMGLYFGASLLSLFHVFYYFLSGKDSDAKGEEDDADEKRGD